MEVSGRKEWDKKSAVSRTKQKILCQPCQGDGDTVEAEAFCETCNEFICGPCLKVHRKMAMSKNHVIRLKDKMPTYKDKQRDPCSELCTVHKTEIVKFYCEDHNLVGCGDCLILSHKTCSVKLVSDVSDNYDKSEDLEQITTKIGALQRELSSHREEVVTGLKTTDEMSKRIVKEIKLFRQELNKYLDNAEKNLLKEIEKLKTKQVSQLKQIEGEFETIINEMKDCEKKIHLTSDKINDLFVAAKTSQEKMKACQMSTEKLASKCEYEILNFVKSKGFVMLVKNECTIGEITAQKRGMQISNRKSLIGARTKMLKSFNIRDSGDNSDCCITGMEVLSRNELLLVDCINCSVEILNVKENKITSRYITDTNPLDIVSIDSRTFAVTIPSDGEILFINTSNGISKSHSITVRNECRGIDYRDGVLAVSFIYPASVQLLDMKGLILSELDIQKHCIFPDCIAFSNDNKSFILSNEFNGVLCEFSVDGNLKGKIASGDMENISGLVMTDDGAVIVCCNNSTDNLKIYNRKTGEMLSIPVKGVKRPYTLALSDDQSTILVYDNSEKDIKVFDIINK